MGVEAEVKRVLKDRAVPFPDHRVGGGTGGFWSVLEQFRPHPSPFLSPQSVSVSSSRRGLVIAMVASLIFIVLLRFLAGIMVWVMIVLVILVLGYGERCPRGWEPSPCSPSFPFHPFCTPQAESLDPNIAGVEQHLALERQLDDFLLSTPGIFHCYVEYAQLKGEAGSDVSLTDLGFQTDLRVYLHLRQTWLAFSESTEKRAREGRAQRFWGLLGLLVALSKNLGYGEGQCSMARDGERRGRAGRPLGSAGRSGGLGRGGWTVPSR